MFEAIFKRKNNLFHKAAREDYSIINQNSSWYLRKLALLFAFTTAYCLFATACLFAAYTITTVAGTGIAGYFGNDGPAASSKLNNPYSVAVDSSGNIYIADYGNNVIRKVNTDVNEIITTVAGNGVLGYSGDDGAAVSAQLNRPCGVTVDSSGNIYIADTNNRRIRKVDTGGIITTIAGNGTLGYSGDNGPATSAKLSDPHNVAVDSSGNIYIADTINNCIRKVNTKGIITTIAGNGGYGYSGDNGPATSAQLLNPTDMVVDSSGNIHIADWGNHRIRKVNKRGIINTVAGNGIEGYSGDNGPATSAQLADPYSVAVDSSGNIYIADTNNNRIRKVDTGGIITSIAGSGEQGYSEDDDAATSSQLDWPLSVAVDSSGNIFIADWGNHRIRKLTP